jgi:hypothetical protein
VIAAITRFPAKKQTISREKHLTIAKLGPNLGPGPSSKEQRPAAVGGMGFPDGMKSLYRCGS